MTDGERLKDRKRRDILRAAVATFHQFGFDNSSMDVIAETAGVSKRTVYNHFPSKDELFAAIVRQLQDSPSAAEPFTYDAAEALEPQLSRIAGRIMQFYSSSDFRCLARVIVSRLLHAPELAQELFAGGKIFEASLVAWIRAAMKDERLETSDPIFSARQFLGMLETFAVWPQLLKGEPDPSKSQTRKIVEATVTMFLAHHSRTRRVR